MRRVRLEVRDKLVGRDEVAKLLLDFLADLRENGPIALPVEDHHRYRFQVCGVINETLPGSMVDVLHGCLDVHSAPIALARRKVATRKRTASVGAAGSDGCTDDRR